MDIRIRNWLYCTHLFGEDMVLAERALQLSDIQDAQKPSAPPQMVARPVLNAPVQARAPDVSWDSLDSIKTLEELRAAVCHFDACPLKKTALHTVFSDGDPKSPVMFVGEAPGAEEDKQGLPFVGQSGQLLNQMLRAIGLKREEVYITNVVYWRPPGNRTPDSIEIEQCLPFLEKHIELMRPKVVVLLGATAMKAVLQLSSGLSKARGMFHQHVSPSGITTPVMVTFHPSYLLRSPGQKMLAWQDFMMLKKALSDHGNS